MSQTLLHRSTRDTTIRPVRVGEDVLVYLKGLMSRFSAEYEAVVGHEPGLIQQMDFSHCCDVFPRLSPAVQAYAMAAIATTYMTACVRKTEGFEHLYLICPIEIAKFHDREFVPDAEMFTISNPCSLKRLNRIDSSFAQYISDFNPIHNGNVHHFIEQVRTAPDELSKAYIAGLIATTAFVRIKTRCKDFDRWFLGQLYAS